MFVLIAIFVIPIILFLFFIFSGYTFKVLWLPEPYSNIVIMISPYFFSVGWLFILILFANRISTSLDKIDLNSQVIPQRLKIFYGFNAIVVMIVFGFPLLTPLICILSFASFGYRLATIGRDWDKEEKVPKYAIYISILFALVPAIISLFTFMDMLEFSQYIWENYWIDRIGVLYKFSMALCTSLTFGALIILVKTGASEYEKVKYLNTKELNLTWVNIVEVVLFGFFAFLEYFYSEILIIDAIYISGFLVACFITLVNLIKNRKELDFSKYFIGYILTIVLLGLNALTFEPDITQTIEYVSIITSAILFIVIYFVIFFRYEED